MKSLGTHIPVPWQCVSSWSVYDLHTYQSVSLWHTAKAQFIHPLGNVLKLIVDIRFNDANPFYLLFVHFTIFFCHSTLQKLNVLHTFFFCKFRSVCTHQWKAEYQRARKTPLLCSPMSINFYGLNRHCSCIITKRKNSEYGIEKDVKPIFAENGI